VRNFEKALAEFDEAIRLAPNMAVYFYNRSFVRLEQGATEQAINDLDEAIRLNPKNADYYRRRGQIWLCDDDDRALHDLDEAIRLKPQAAAYYTDRGRAWFNKGEYDKAIRDFLT
jgi:tetratricopeptide (TPR) repeat protein